MPNDHARLLSLLRRGLALAAGLLIVACSSGTPTPSAPPSAAPTPSPTSQPSSQSSTGPTSQPSTEPTTEPSTQPSTGPTTGPSTQPSTEPTAEPSPLPVPLGKVDHPTDPTAVVLRIDFAGGFINPAGNLLRAPAFTLYGDNTVVFRPTTDPTGTGMPPFQRAQLSVDLVDALLTRALVRDHLKDAQTSYPGNPDSGSTIFSIEAGGVKKQVSVFGLSPNPKGPNAAVLKGLEDLASTLTDFESQVRAGKVESVEPSGGASDIGVTGLDGKSYLLSLRPVLPGEIF